MISTRAFPRSARAGPEASPSALRDLATLVVALASVLAIAAALPMPARAGPPFVTDDPEPVEFRHWEIYIASAQSQTANGRTGTLPHVEINNGIAENLQFHIILPYAFAHAAGEPMRRGYGDTEVGLKYRFVQEGPKRPMIGAFPLVELPTGNAERGLGSGHTQWFLPVWLQKSWGPWTTYGGGGYWINPGEGNRNFWLFGWEIQKDLNKHLTLGGELFGTTPAVIGGRSQMSFNLGGYYNFDEERHLLFSGGRGNADTRFTSYLAFQWTFGPRKHAGR